MDGSVCWGSGTDQKEEGCDKKMTWMDGNVCWGSGTDQKE